MNLAEHRWVSALWCDDIRMEVGNKPSFMGVYTGEMTFPAVPTTLGKLSVFIRLVTPFGQPFKKIKIRVEKNDLPIPLGLIEIPDSEVDKASAEIAILESTKTDSDDKEPRAMTMMFMVNMAGVQILETTKWLRVYVDNESETLKSFKLRILVNAAVDLAR